LTASSSATYVLALSEHTSFHRVPDRIASARQTSRFPDNLIDLREPRFQGGNEFAIARPTKGRFFMSKSPALARRLVGITAVLGLLGAVPALALQGGASAATPAVKVGLSIVGSSQSSISSATRMFPNAKVGRYFAQNIQLYSQSSIRFFPAAMEIWISWNTPPAQVASGAFDATFAKILQSWNASGRTIKWSWTHEADNPGSHYNSAQIRAGWARLLAVEKKYPSSRVKSMSIYEAYMLDPRMPHGNPANWYVPADILGFDTYVPANEARAIAYARSKGKPWSIPETGKDLSDAANVAFMKGMVAGWKAYPPVGVAWFSSTNGGFSKPLTRLPLTLAYLKSLAG
jgi:hypothetical protein